MIRMLLYFWKREDLQVMCALQILAIYENKRVFTLSPWMSRNGCGQRSLEATMDVPIPLDCEVRKRAAR